ncbi:MAG: hypothetical protein OEY05_06250 [Paracoccaceae bacterium]|nr:hypothetical protein [Paracoccaceae bacterium]
MNFSIIAQTAAALVIATTCSAAAEQFAVKMATPVEGASQQLLESLHIREIDAVEINGVHFLVIEAKDEGFVEAYVFARAIDAMGLYRLKADWTGAGLSSLPVDAREPFLEKTTCGFCTS